MSGRPKVNTKSYARDVRLSVKYPGLAEMDDATALLCHGPQTEADEAKCDAEISRVSRAIRTTCDRSRMLLVQEPYEIPQIAMVDVFASETRRGAYH